MKKEENSSSNLIFNTIFQNFFLFKNGHFIYDPHQFCGPSCVAYHIYGSKIYTDAEYKWIEFLEAQDHWNRRN